MESSAIVLFFDYVDPLSYVADHTLTALESTWPPGLRVERVPLELRPPPEPLLGLESDEWARRWVRAEAACSDLGLALVEPRLVPWTRKAHELVLHATEYGKGSEVHNAVFESVFVLGRDVGRIDVLVDIASESGLDAMEAKAVLDVDKLAASVASSRPRAWGMGVHAPPAVFAHGELLRDFHNRDALRTFLCPP